MRRRHMLVLTGGAISASLAGCIGDDADGADDTDDNGNGDDTDDTGNGDDTGDDSEDGVESLLTGGFTAVSQGGFISINEEDGPEHARDEGVILPAEAEGESPFEIHGEVGDDETWESTGIELPDLGVEDFTVDVDFPEGLHGELRESDGVMTFRGEANVVIADGEFSFEFEATTGDSGTMSGELSLDSDPIRVVAVDNEFTVEDDTDTIADTLIGLPSEESGENWIEVVLDIHQS